MSNEMTEALNEQMASMARKISYSVNADQLAWCRQMIAVLAVAWDTAGLTHTRTANGLLRDRAVHLVGVERAFMAGLAKRTREANSRASEIEVIRLQEFTE